jgi:PHD/YefM family antitoxin component YafN of YafNO toxin-antitoxin module
MRHLKDTKRPVILTVNGKAAAVVVQDAEAYQNLLDLTERAARDLRAYLSDELTREMPARPARDSTILRRQF